MDTQQLTDAPEKKSGLALPLLLLSFFILLIFAFGALYFKNSIEIHAPARACTLEARLCPDGTTVGRGGPNCEFPSCPPIQPTVINTNQPTVEPTPTASFSANCCTRGQLSQGYQCQKNCGPPVERLSGPPATYSCLSPEQAEQRKYYGCPICLASNTMISTPQGDKNVQELQTGDLVWSTDKSGKKISVPISQTFFAKVPPSHNVFHLVLSDKREVWLSPYHSLTGKKYINDLKFGSYYDKAIVKKIDLIPYAGTKTYDILPASETGYYWANGILIGSTLKKF